MKWKFGKKSPPPEQSVLTNADRNIIRTSIEHGTPCIPFPPIQGLADSMRELKMAGLTGYYIARIPALYPDGTLKYLYKEEGSLYWACITLANQMQATGRSYFLFGLDVLNDPGDADHPYIEPDFLMLHNLALHGIEFLDEVEFAPLLGSNLDLLYLPAGERIKVGATHVVNFALGATKYPLGEQGDPSQCLFSYEDWMLCQFPTSGADFMTLVDPLTKSLQVQVGA